jgi:hypothetical protein
VFFTEGTFTKNDESETDLLMAKLQEWAETPGK